MRDRAAGGGLVLKLPRLSTNFRITDERGYASTEFQLFWQQAMGQIETAINGVSSALEATQVALSAATSAQNAADSADAAALSASEAAVNATNSSALANSYVTGLTINAADVGANVTVSISAHTRFYATSPITSVSVSAGNLTGLTYSTQYYVYYDQPSRLGGSVNYIFTTNLSEIAQLGNRHSVGTVITPAAAGAPANGGGTIPPGGNFEEP